MTKEIKNSLVTNRDQLKRIKLDLDSISSKELKILNLDLEREIIEKEENDE